MFRVITPKSLFFPEIKEFVDQWWRWWWGGGWDHHCDHSQISESPGWVDRPSFGWRLRQWEASVLTETTQKLQLSHSALRTGQQQQGGNIKQFSSLCQPPAGVYYCLTIPNHVNFPLNLKQQIKLRKTICQEALVVQQRRSEWPRCRWCPARRAAGWGQSSPLRTTGISPARCQCSTRLVRGEGRSEVRWGRSDKLRHCFNIQQGDRRGPNILNIHRWYESFWFQLVFWPGKIRCKSLKCDLSPEVKLSKIPFSVVLINDS